MLAFLMVCILVVLVIRWIYLRERLNDLESRMEHLRSTVLDLLEKPAAPAPFKVPRNVVPASAPEEPPVEAVSAQPQPAERPHMPDLPAMAPAGPMSESPLAPSPRDWEATLGGNWLNKAGVVLLVIGLALALAYSFAHIGPLGRVAISLAVSSAMLAAGVLFEPREPYRVFARGLLGGGWAGLYTTVYAMHAVKEALVIPDPILGTALLIAVAAGMILHSLRYRSQTVTGLAYFIAFGTLAIVEANLLAVVALIPLAASLLYLAHRFNWSKMALYGLIASYSVILLRGDHGATLWQAESLFVVFWLLFEVFDILHPESLLLALNAAGFLGLSLLKWNSAAPHDVWTFLAAAAAAYLAGALLRWRAAHWHIPAALACALAAAAIFARLDHRWIAPALLVEAELAYLAGVRLKAPFLRWLGMALFVVETGRLLLFDMQKLPIEAWTSTAIVNAVIFYANYFIEMADLLYGYAASALLCLVIGYRAPADYRSLQWLALATGSFSFGWWRRLFDFRLQGYLVGIVGLTAAGMEAGSNLPPVWGAVLVTYAVALCAAGNSPARFIGRESDVVRQFGSAAAALSAVVLIWRLIPGPYLGLGWSGLTAVLLVLGLLDLPADLVFASYATAALAFLRCWGINFSEHLLPVLTAAISAALFYAAQLYLPRGRFPRIYFSLLATSLISLLLGYESSGSLLTVAWGIQGVALLSSGFPLRDRALRLSGLALLMTCILKLFLWDLRHLETLPRIFSFIVLGLILVAVSWIYTRFREHVERYL